MGWMGGWASNNVQGLVSRDMYAAVQWLNCLEIWLRNGN